ncbi:hypothetical protein [Halopelagius longus]|uniref:Uncharacterized protein n=1 Tax=Halopelagius longus TaxID=1236180 RepID=A0A1H1B4H0_9EURY|nr:hypothetical protein [Halopelagius longus]RDI70637.1 hypothetical protein DWB78_02245 [Halopelagius longus]SDQ46802.1 hypothetical protein SAMN05216278_1632 [Halopelagius longus]
MLKEVQFDGRELRALSGVSVVFFGFVYFFYVGLATLDNGVFLAVTVLLGVVFAYMVASVVNTLLRREE